MTEHKVVIYVIVQPGGRLRPVVTRYIGKCPCGWTSALYEDEERATVAGHQHIARRR